MAGFDWLWKALGRKSSRNQKRSLAIVDQAESHFSDLEALDNAALAARARALAEGGEISDQAEFLAILGIAAQRTLGLKPFAVQSQAVLRLSLIHI